MYIGGHLFERGRLFWGAYSKGVLIWGGGGGSLIRRFIVYLVLWKLSGDVSYAS